MLVQTDCRLEPPTVSVSQREDGRATIVEVESANRPGTLCEVRQSLSCHATTWVPGRLLLRLQSVMHLPGRGLG